jgi:peroxiredoxin Q/BCP
MTTLRKPAPAFCAPSSLGRDVSLSDYRGRYLVLYFYPAAFTYGCTRETVRFRDATAELQALHADIVGVSRDPLDKQCKFAEHYQAKFPLLADTDGAIARAYGVVFPVLSWQQRVTFVIDPESQIVARFHHELQFERHVADVLAFLQTVQAGRASG